MKLKAHHLAWTVAGVVGILYAFHMFKTHGTFKSALQGLGVSS